MEAVHTIFPFDGLITNLMDTKMQNYTWYRNCVSSLYWETVQFIEKLILLISSIVRLISNAFLFKLIEEWNLTFPFVMVRLASLDNITWWRDKKCSCWCYHGNSYAANYDFSPLSKIEVISDFKNSLMFALNLLSVFKISWTANL